MTPKPVLPCFDDVDYHSQIQGGLDVLICICLDVSQREVLAAIQDGAGTVEAVSERCGAGGGCGSCCDTIECMLKEQRERRAGAANAGGRSPSPPAA
jgi:bacterioferritin-associated ferredoxin